MRTLEDVRDALLDMAGDDAKAVAWMRRTIRYKAVDGHREGEIVVSEAQVYFDDIPLYEHPPADSGEAKDAHPSVQTVNDILDGVIASHEHDGYKVTAAELRHVKYKVGDLVQAAKEARFELKMAIARKAPLVRAKEAQRDAVLSLDLALAAMTAESREGSHE